MVYNMMCKKFCAKPAHYLKSQEFEALYIFDP